MNAEGGRPEHGDRLPQGGPGAEQGVQLSGQQDGSSQASVDTAHRTGQSRMPAQLVAHLGEFVSVVAADGSLIATNHGGDPEEEPIEGRDTRSWVHPEDQHIVSSAFVELLQDPEARTRTLVRVRRFGEPYRWMETTGVNRLADPAVRGLVFVSRDVEEREQLQQRAVRALQGQRLVADLGLTVLREGVLDSALEHALEALSWLLSASYVTLLEPFEGGELRVTRQAGERALPPGHVLPHGAGPAVPEMAERGVASTLAVPLLGTAGESGLLEAGWPEGVAPDEDARPLLQAVANVLAGARAREQREVAAVVRALHDPLTGLPTRPLLLDRLDHALARSARAGAGEVAVLLLDLDGFKDVNDRYGHEAGDAVLAQLGERLARCVRPGDTAGRLGGDEFVVVCEDVADPAAVVDLRRRVLAAFEQPFAVPRVGTLRLRGSIGSAFSSASDHDRGALLHAADLAMYRDKRQAARARGTEQR